MMGPKRNHNALAVDNNDESSSYAPSKRRREQQGSKPKQSEVKPDPTYGQRVAFPGLDDDEPAQLTDEDFDFEEHGDALAYLKAVRQEASNVPHVLVAPKAGPQIPPHLRGSDSHDRSIYDDGVGDSRGYYHDGAYTAAPSPTLSNPSSLDQFDPDDPAPFNPDRTAHNNAALREAYYTSLTTQFLALRALLHQTPPPHLIAALSSDHGTEVAAFGPRSWTFRVWSWRLRHTDPLPVQLAALDRQAALKILRVLLGGKFLRRGHELRERTSRWLWALLARLPDRGEMDYAEVGWVRELGKRAVLMMVSMAQVDALREAVEGNLEGDGEEEEEEEEFVGEVVVDEEDGEGSGGSAAQGDAGAGDTRLTGVEGECEPAATRSTAVLDANHDGGQGEMDMDLDDGEVTDDDDVGRQQPIVVAGNQDMEADIAAAKARLLARLEAVPETEQEDATDPNDVDEQPQFPERNETTHTDFDAARAQANMWATLNMILTVAGEFYGQRDLLEFRDPFPAL